jgi:hypothetical protein
MDWMVLAKDMARWKVLVKEVMKLWGPLNAGNFLTG